LTLDPPRGYASARLPGCLHPGHPRGRLQVRAGGSRRGGQAGDRPHSWTGYQQERWRGCSRYVESAGRWRLARRSSGVIRRGPAILAPSIDSSGAAAGSWLTTSMTSTKPKAARSRRRAARWSSSTSGTYPSCRHQGRGIGGCPGCVPGPISTSERATTPGRRSRGRSLGHALLKPGPWVDGLRRRGDEDEPRPSTYEGTSPAWPALRSSRQVTPPAVVATEGVRALWHLSRQKKR
jgi:hypothetical protein